MSFELVKPGAPDSPRPRQRLFATFGRHDTYSIATRDIECQTNLAFGWRRRPRKPGSGGLSEPYWRQTANGSDGHRGKIPAPTSARKTVNS